jgi:hypothetical protein
MFQTNKQNLKKNQKKNLQPVSQFKANMAWMVLKWCKNMAIYGKVKRHLFKNVRSMDILCAWTMPSWMEVGVTGHNFES